MNLWLAILLLTPGAPAFDVDRLETVNRRVQRVYDAVLEGDQVNYKKIKADQSLMDDLKAYQDFIGDLDLDAITDTQQKIAILSNAYNVYTLIGVTEAWPVESVRDIRPFFGFFKKMKWPFAGGEATLDDIENKHIRKLGEARIHFIINCASVSCPPLPTDVLTAQNLERIMEAQTRSYLNNDTHNRFDKAKQRIEISRIFKWFREDWGSEDAVVAFVKKYRDGFDWTPKDVDYVEYDWNLNGPTQ